MTDSLIYKYAYNTCTPDERMVVRDMLVRDFSECFEVVGLMKERAKNEMLATEIVVCEMAVSASPAPKGRRVLEGKARKTSKTLGRSLDEPLAVPDGAVLCDESVDMESGMDLSRADFSMPKPDIVGLLNRYLRS